jgi:hypothetical protein
MADELGGLVRDDFAARDLRRVREFLSAGSPQQPLVEFVAADDYEQTREVSTLPRRLAIAATGQPAPQPGL